VLPLLVFGVDETLDPARFAWLPVPPAVLLRGMYAAGFVGVPAALTLLTSQGLVLGMGVRAGAGAAAATFAGTVAGLCLCVAASRAVTSAMATALRSRRARDAAVLVLALLAGGIGPLQLAGFSIVQSLGADRLAVAARVLAWTPFGAPYAVGGDVAAGRWPVALARLVIVAVSVALLLKIWAVTLPAAILGASGSAPRRSAGRDRQVLPGVFGALVEREWRYWWRDPRRRTGLITVLMVATALPVMMYVLSGGLAVPGALLFSGAMVGSLLANQFGFDGSAYAANLLAGVPGRLEVAARMVAVTALTLPPLALVAVLLGAVGGDGRVAAAVGVGVAAYGTSAALASVVSVLAPYALPATSNPFAMSAGTGGLRGFASFGPVLAGGLVAWPLSVATVPAALTLALGTAIGGALLVAGALIAGTALDERAPHVLQAVSPRH
jgi:ABC-2 type transport system permease protein